MDALGVDEHVWSHTGPPGNGMVTGIMDHSRDAKGAFMPGCWTSFRAGQGTYAHWLKDRGAGFTAASRQRPSIRSAARRTRSATNSLAAGATASIGTSRPTMLA